MIKAVQALVYNGRNIVSWAPKPARAPLNKGRRLVPPNDDGSAETEEIPATESVVEAEIVEEGGSEEQGEIESCSVDAEVDIYLQYKSALIMNGTLQWRVKTAQKECVVMSDMNAKTGKILVRSHFYNTSTDVNRVSVNVGHGVAPPPNVVPNLTIFRRGHPQAPNDQKCMDSARAPHP